MTEDDAIKMTHEIVAEMCGVPIGTNLTPIVRALRRVERDEREACAMVCETLVLTVDEHKSPSASERHLMSVTEAGYRGAFADAIRTRSNVKLSRPPTVNNERSK